MAKCPCAKNNLVSHSFKNFSSFRDFLFLLLLKREDTFFANRKTKIFWSPHTGLKTGGGQFFGIILFVWVLQIPPQNICICSRRRKSFFSDFLFPTKTIQKIENRKRGSYLNKRLIRNQNQIDLKEFHSFLCYTVLFTSKTFLYYNPSLLT